MENAELEARIAALEERVKELQVLAGLSPTIRELVTEHVQRRRGRAKPPNVAAAMAQVARATQSTDLEVEADRMEHDRKAAARRLRLYRAVVSALEGSGK